MKLQRKLRVLSVSNVLSRRLKDYIGYELCTPIGSRETTSTYFLLLRPIVVHQVMVDYSPLHTGTSFQIFRLPGYLN